MFLRRAYVYACSKHVGSRLGGADLEARGEDRTACTTRVDTYISGTESRKV